MLGDTNGDFKRKLLGKTEEKVRGYRSVALSHYCGNGYAFCVMISRKLGLEHLGRRLRLRHQLPRSWQLSNGGDQRGVAKNGMNSVLPRSNLAGARQLVRNHEQTGTVAPSENGRLPPVLAHQLARAQKSLICPKRSSGSVTY